VDEVRSLIPQGIESGVTASRAIGYQQILEYLAGELSEEDAIESTQALTRRYARRQVSWFRRDQRTRVADQRRQHCAPPGGALPFWERSADALGLEHVSGAPRSPKVMAPATTSCSFCDPENERELRTEHYRWLADRHVGVGGDGVIRAASTASSPEVASLLEQEPDARVVHGLSQQ
jgi:hypothetical protein